MRSAFARSQHERLNARYASDVTDDEDGLIEPLLPPAKHGGRRRTTDLREVLNAILYLMQAREQAGKEASPMTGVVDSQSVETTEAGGLRGHDGGKKIKGRRRHPVTDTLGFPLNLAVHAANIQDRDGLALACRWIKQRFPWLQCVFADAGHHGPIAAGNAAGVGLRLEIVQRPPHAEGFEIVPRRWAIERTFGWLRR